MRRTKAGSTRERRIGKALSRLGIEHLDDVTIEHRGFTVQLDHVANSWDRLALFETKNLTARLLVRGVAPLDRLETALAEIIALGEDWGRMAVAGAWERLAVWLATPEQAQLSRQHLAHVIGKHSGAEESVGNTYRRVSLITGVLGVALLLIGGA